MKFRTSLKPKGLIQIHDVNYVLIPRKLLRDREIEEIEWEGRDDEIIIRIKLKEEKSGDDE